ncbi:CHAT domain-containing protein [Favolaschia claudopus]|uniref:CHAT domain-containing protein n=1 Tax=Favolaschia claudopus TaxID=2862362 RepID=A0AAW0BYF6_9AGAR
MRAILTDLHEGRFDYVNLVAHMLQMRFEALHETDDIEQSIAFCMEAISLLPEVAAERRSACSHMAHTGLAVSYISRFEALGRLEDLNDSIAQYAMAVELGPQSDGNYCKSVSGLAATLAKRFEYLGTTDDLHRAVSVVRACLASLDEDDVQRITLTLTLADALEKSFNQSGSLPELEEAMDLYRAVIAVRAQEDHSEMVVAVANLATAHHSRYERLHEIDDLNSAINMNKVLLSLEENPGRPTVLNNLANALITRFEETGDQSDLKTSLSYYRDALNINRHNKVDHALALVSMASGLSKSFVSTSRIEDLDEATSYCHQAVSILADGHRHQLAAYDTLANILRQRYRFLGRIRDLEDALVYGRRYLASCRPQDSGRPSALASVADILLQRFHCFCLAGDLEQALNYRLEALKLCPPNHRRQFEYLYGLAFVVLEVYILYSANPDHLEAALENYKQALSLCPEGHCARPRTLSGLAASYSARFKRFQRIDDLETGICLLREAIALSAAPSDYSYFNDLAVDLSIRFDHLGEVADIKEAIALFARAKDSIPSVHPLQPRLDRHLASAYLKQAKIDSHPVLVSTAFSFFEASFYSPVSEPWTAVHTLTDWADAAQAHQRRVPFAAYSRAMELMEQSVAATPMANLQHEALMAAPEAWRTIAMDAAAIAIAAGHFSLAVELLERGRAILWTRLRGYRASLERLRDVNDPLATRFENVSKQLEILAFSRSIARNTLEPELHFDGMITSKRVVQEERETLLNEIRQLEGFEHFMRPVPYKALRCAAEGGPVVLINCSELRCDALILRDHEEPSPFLVQLPEATLSGLKELNQEFTKARGRDSSKQLVSVLRTLWKTVVQPIVMKLQALKVPHKTRIWWCPTSFLCNFPLHAAGMYTKLEPDANLPNLFISSYTPTLCALIQARIDKRPNAHDHIQALVIGHSTADLPAVEPEIAEIRALGPFVNTLVEEAATPLRVLGALQQHSYMHFACHAIQRQKPFESAFHLHDGELQLLDIVQARLPRADFAFLSACSTAVGDSVTPDEAIHLAAAMQFAGFRSVVGTLWKMADEDGPFVAREFYGHIFRAGAAAADYTDAAAALHGAVRALRKKDPQSISRWINFIHVGA